MPDTDPTVVSALVAELRERLQQMAKRPIPPLPTKKLLDALEPALRDGVLAAADELRAEHAARKAVASSLAKQARAAEKTMLADAQRLLEVAGRIGADPDV